MIGKWERCPLLQHLFNTTDDQLKLDTLKWKGHSIGFLSLKICYKLLESNYAGIWPWKI